MIRHNFRMHRAGIFLFRLMLVLVITLVIRAIEVNRPYLGAAARCERNCANINQYVFAHLELGSNSVVAAVSAAAICANTGGTPAATAEDSRSPIADSLGQRRRSVSEKAPLQN